MIFDLDWWENAAKTSKKLVRGIHEKGVDAFVVFIGPYQVGAYDTVKESQEKARGYVGAGFKRERVRIRRIQAPTVKYPNVKA